MEARVASVGATEAPGGRRRERWPPGPHAQPATVARSPLRALRPSWEARAVGEGDSGDADEDGGEVAEAAVAVLVRMRQEIRRCDEEERAASERERRAQRRFARVAEERQRQEAAERG